MFLKKLIFFYNSGMNKLRMQKRLSNTLDIFTRPLQVIQTKIRTEPKINMSHNIVTVKYMQDIRPYSTTNSNKYHKCKDGNEFVMGMNWFLTKTSQFFCHLESNGINARDSFKCIYDKYFISLNHSSITFKSR